MFPTAYKDKIPKTLSYPIKAKLISETFADVPQAEELHLSFSNIWALRGIKSGEPCKVLKAEYYYRQITQYDTRSSEEFQKNRFKWEIEVQAIPNEISHHVAELLQKESFAKVREWLFSKNNLSGKSACAWFAVIYNYELEKLEYKEHLYW